MPLETATYISELVPTNPAPGDLKAQGDDHIRMKKRVLKTAFAGIPGVVYITGTDGGAANAYTVAPADPVPAYGVRMLIAFAPTAANTGACTLAVSSLGAKPLVTASGDPLVAGDLLAGVVQTAIYDGAQFRLLAVTKGYVDRGDAANLAYTKQADADLRTYIDSLAFSTALPNQSLGFLRSDGTNAAFTRTHTGYAQNEVRGADIASAATTDLTNATGNHLHVTGNAAISTIIIPAGAERTVVFDGSPTLVNSANLPVPGAANFAVKPGDAVIFRGEPNGVTKIVSYLRASGLPVIGDVISKDYVSPDQVMTAGGTLTIAHGLGVLPKAVLAFLRCVVADANGQVGDVVPVGTRIDNNDNTTTRVEGANVSFNSTNVMVAFSNNAFRNFNTTNWRYFVRALA